MNYQFKGKTVVGLYENNNKLDNFLGIILLDASSDLVSAEKISVILDNLKRGRSYFYGYFKALAKCGTLTNNSRHILSNLYDVDEWEFVNSEDIVVLDEDEIDDILYEYQIEYSIFLNTLTVDMWLEKDSEDDEFEQEEFNKAISRAIKYPMNSKVQLDYDNETGRLAWWFEINEDELKEYIRLMKQDCVYYIETKDNHRAILCFRDEMKYIPHPEIYDQVIVHNFSK